MDNLDHLIHIEKPNAINTLVYLIVFNVFWTLTLFVIPYFNLTIGSPWVLVGASCVAWHTLCGILGLEPYTNYPANLVLHISGSLLTVVCVATLVGI